ncbi:MAG: MarR family transcriptional regulator [Bacteroidetes bacterium B1(2017)]|nr:MAG: MarR family transcriptional regulator [Bacteroidetes bacterium B1(2017)]
MASLEQEIKQKSFASEQVKANLNVLFTANWIYNKISSFLKPHNLTHEQLNVLRILRGSHPKTMCQKDVLSRMIAPSSNVTLIIKKLKTKNFILVHQSEKDKREYVISITKEGLSLLKKLDQVFDNEKGSLLKLSESEAFHLNALLDKIRA